MPKTDIAKLRGRIAEDGVLQREVADILGLASYTFSAYLRERRAAPDKFVERAHEALDRLESAEAARQRVLEETA